MRISDWSSDVCSSDLGNSGADRHLRADDAVTTVEVLLLAEHMHGATLALGVAVLASSQLGHDAARVHAAGEHVSVVTVAGDHRIPVVDGRLHADDDGFLADVKVTEYANPHHTAELPRIRLERAP